MTIQKNGAPRFSCGPFDWKGGSQYASLKDTKFDLRDPLPTEITQALARKKDIANALTAAALSHSDAKRITKIEAIIAAEHTNCRNLAETWVTHVRLLAPVKTPWKDTWATDLQSQGRRGLDALQNAYGDGEFECGEALALGAENPPSHLRPSANLVQSRRAVYRRVPSRIPCRGLPYWRQTAHSQNLA